MAVTAFIQIVESGEVVASHHLEFVRLPCVGELIGSGAEGPFGGGAKGPFYRVEMVVHATTEHVVPSVYLYVVETTLGENLPGLIST